MELCNHEEAETRLIAHLLDAIINGCHRFIIRTMYTDVVVIIVGKFHLLKSFCEDVDIWVAFGIGKHFSYIYMCINALYEDLG